MNVNDVLVVTGYLAGVVFTFFAYMKYFIAMNDDGDGSTFWDEDSMIIGVFIFIALFLGICWVATLWVFPAMGLIWLVGKVAKSMKVKTSVVSES